MPGRCRARWSHCAARRGVFAGLVAWGARESPPVVFRSTQRWTTSPESVCGTPRSVLLAPGWPSIPCSRQQSNSAWSLGITGWVPLIGVFRTGLEIGWVLGHPSWFVGPVLGAQVRNVRVEVAARSHVVTFDEITREYGSGTTRELSRRPDSERSWGAIARVLLLSR